MRGMLLVARRDLAAYLNSYWGYLVVAAILLADGILFNAFALGDKAKYSAAVMEDFFHYSFGLTVIASVLLTMRSVAEERQTGTIVLVESSPLSPAEFVGGKALAAYTVVALLLLATLYMPALVFVNGKVSYGQIFAGYLGLLLVAAAATAVGVLTSSLANSQLVAGIVSGLLLLLLVIPWMLARVVDPPLGDIVAYFSLYERHFQAFGRGIIQSESIVYFVSVAFVALMLATRVASLRRWR